VRETLFNWLAPHLPGARCLDPYAGTGALGLEALSRGAAECWFLERNGRVAAALESRLLQFIGPPGAATTEPPPRGRVLAADAPHWLGHTLATPFDIVFLDPPYAAGNLGELCTLLARGWLAPGAAIYLETGRDRPLPGLPAGWQLHRESQAGDVRFGLAIVRSSQS
jgi:16S rRNA (guanine966-N2)-methyltransferase